MAWQSYSLDQKAQKLVLGARARERQSLNQSFKMRETVVYGLERFWGEHLRLQVKKTDKAKSQYWQEVWQALVEIMSQAGVEIPNKKVDVDNPKEVKAMAEKLWELDLETQRLTLAVLTQLCDCLVWWTQRYKGSTKLTPDKED